MHTFLFAWKMFGHYLFFPPLTFPLNMYWINIQHVVVDVITELFLGSRVYILIFKSMGKTRKPFKFLHNRNYQNSLLLELNTFDALIHMFLYHSTPLSYALLSYLIQFYIASTATTWDKERHHLQDIVLIWQVWKKKIIVKGLHI